MFNAGRHRPLAVGRVSFCYNKIAQSVKTNPTNITKHKTAAYCPGRETTSLRQIKPRVF